MNLSVDKATRFCGVGLNNALKERYGANCHYCKQDGHWYNNCRQFWDNVKNRLIDVPPGDFDTPKSNYLLLEYELQRIKMIFLLLLVVTINTIYKLMCDRPHSQELLTFHVHVLTPPPGQETDTNERKTKEEKKKRKQKNKKQKT